MFSLKDVQTLEEGGTRKDAVLSLQRAINSGMWSMQGSYGRSMMRAIEAGECMLGLSHASDAYGNRIPSRTEVQEGTKGSRSFVVANNGEDWAVMLEGA